MLLDTARPVKTPKPAFATTSRKAEGRKSAELPTQETPPRWLTALPPDEQNSVCWHAVEHLKVHPACSAMPWSAKAYDRVRESVRQHGLLFPLAVDEHCDVLDGRYRLAAAKELGIARVPTLRVTTDDPARFVHEMKAAREHLSDKMRAALAVAFQEQLKAGYIATRTRRMNAARLGTVADKSVNAPEKRNSRTEARNAYAVGERDFRAMSRLATKRPDLFNRVLTEELPPEAAVKQMGRNVEAARVAAARAAVVRPEDVTDTALENRIHEGEAEEVMQRIPDGTASLVLFSPPYHGVTGIDYDPPLPQQTYEQYLAHLRVVLEQSYRVSRRGGRLAIVFDTVRNPDGPDRGRPVFAHILRIAGEVGWLYMNDIAWIKDEISGSKTNFGSLGLCSAAMLNRNHEWVLLLYRETHVLEGDRNLCDLTREEHLAWLGTAWTIKPEVSRDIRRHHPAPFPEELVERLIKLLTYRRDLVLDPMNGSGTTTAVAARLQRRYIGIDRSPQYCAFARQRVANECVETAERPATMGENAAAGVAGATAPSRHRAGAAERSGERT